jgi:hypothetical protein
VKISGGSVPIDLEVCHVSGRRFEYDGCSARTEFNQTIKSMKSFDQGNPRPKIFIPEINNCPINAFINDVLINVVGHWFKLLQSSNV